MKKLITSLDELENFARDFKNNLKTNPKAATVIGLYGDLGAGKTAFVKMLAKAFGVSEHVTSPTFVLMKRFAIQDSGFTNFIHIDAYRLTKGEELAKLGWQELIADPKNLICIEWPENVAKVMPEHVKMEWKFVDEGTREVEY